MQGFNYKLNGYVSTNYKLALTGSRNNVISYVKNTLQDQSFGNELEQDKDFGVDSHSPVPEKSENNDHKGGSIIAIADNSVLLSFANALGFGRDKEGVKKTASLSINHGAGHNSGLDHSDEKSDTDPGGNDSPIMLSGDGQINNFGSGVITFGNGEKGVFSRNIKGGVFNNQKYIDAIIDRFGGGKNSPASDNYSRLMKGKEKVK